MASSPPRVREKLDDPVLSVDVQVRAMIEEHRLQLGLTRDQVLICTDMYGSTSGTYLADVSSNRKGVKGVHLLRTPVPTVAMKARRGNT